ncbi:cell division protein ZipA [Shewanella sp.]|nr:cell division protein ZipA [Shewanella sp.]
MESLQLVFLILGAIAIFAILIHGFWSIRKQQPVSYKKGMKTDLNRRGRDAEGFDNDGIGQVRVVKAERAEQEMSPPSAAVIGSAAVSQETPNSSSTSMNADTFSLSETPTQKATRTANPAPVEPSLTANAAQPDTQPEPVQSSLFTDAVLSDDEEHVGVATENAAEPDDAPLPDPQDVLVLHVVAKDGEELNGAQLLPCLLALNFKHGDMDIFHRHEDNAGTGKILFSMANMVKPGVFDPDYMEQFSTLGVVLFMTLPCHGDALRNFSTMLSSAEQIAEDLNGELLDGGRDEWQESTKQDYIQRIKAQLNS